MSIQMERDFVRLIDSAPHVECPRCNIEMTLRTLVPKSDSDEFSATYRCPKCGTDTQREFWSRLNQPPQTAYTPLQRKKSPNMGSSPPYPNEGAYLPRRVSLMPPMVF